MASARRCCTTLNEPLTVTWDGAGEGEGWVLYSTNAKKEPSVTLMGLYH